MYSLPYSIHHIICKDNVFYLFNDILQTKYNSAIQPDMHITQFQDLSLKINCYYIVRKYHIHPSTNKILFVALNTQLSFTASHWKLVWLPKENQLYFIPVFVYTHIKVKLKKGRKEMASPKPNYTCRLSLLAAITS